MSRLHTRPSRSGAFCALLCLSALVSLPATASAQRTGSTTTAKSPSSLAEQLKGERASTDQAARAIVEQFRLPPEDVLPVLLTAGFDRAEVAGASVGVLRMRADAAATVLRSAKMDATTMTRGFATTGMEMRTVTAALQSAGFTARDATRALTTELKPGAYDVYKALTDNGYSVVEASGAARDLGVPVDMDCIGPDGMPVPCGNMGRDNNEPVMGQVSWSPSGSGQTGQEVVFESTNIPPVDVLFDGEALEILEMSSSLVRVRLPDATGSGPLAFRRRSDGVLGVIEDPFEVTAAPETEESLPWSGAAAAALDGAFQDLDLWMLASRFDGSRCTVNATIATGTAGVLQGPSSFSGMLRTKLMSHGMPDEVSDAWEEVVQDAFFEWADQLIIPGLPLYPSHAAYPGPQAPPVPNVPMPLISFTSAGAVAMTPMELTERLNAAIPGSDASAAEAEIAEFANELGTSFGLYLTTAQVMMVLGTGPVPSYAPPNVPVGPVVGGSCFSPGAWISLAPSGAQVDLPTSW